MWEGSFWVMLDRNGICFSCGKNVHKVRDCPNAKGKEKIEHLIRSSNSPKRTAFMLFVVGVSKDLTIRGGRYVKNLYSLCVFFS